MMDARNAVPVVLRIVGLFCVAMGFGFFLAAWIYDMRYLGG